MKILSDIYHRFGIWIFFTGTLTIFLSSGYYGTVTGAVFLILGSLFALSDPLVIFIAQRREDGQLPERSLLFAWGLGLLSLLFFFLRRALDVPVDKIVSGGDPFIVRLQKLLLALFLLSYFASLLWRLALTLGRSSGKSKTISLTRLRITGMNRTVLSVFAALVVLVFVNYLSALRNPVWDLSGYISFVPASRTLIKSVDRKVSVYVFLPVQQAVRSKKRNFDQPELFKIAEDIRNFMQQLPILNSRIEVNFLNADIDADRLGDFGTVNNGTIIFRVLKSGTLTSEDDKPYVERRVYVYSERDMDRLEQEVVRALIHVSSPPRTLYFTAANGERYNFTERMREPDGIEQLNDTLRFYNYTLKKMDQTVAWPAKIPDDADAILIVGPTIPFGPEARLAIIEYVRGGGRLLLAIDPQGKDDFAWLLRGNGGKQFQFDPGPLSFQYPGIAITESLVSHRVTENIRKDKILILPANGRFREIAPAKRPSRKPASGVPDKKHTIQPEAGKGENAPGPLAGLTSAIILNSAPNTVIDTNLDGKKDAREEAGTFPLGIVFEKKAIKKAVKKPGINPATEKKNHGADEKKSAKGAAGEARIVAYAGVGWLSNRATQYRILHRNNSNIILAVDSVLWLTENPLAAAIQPKERKSRSVQITDALKFRNILLGVVLFPIFVGVIVSLGTVLYRRRRKFIGEE